MVSFNQAEAVKQLLSEGWVTVPATSASIGGPITLMRLKPDGTNEQITVLSNGTTQQVTE